MNERHYSMKHLRTTALAVLVSGTLAGAGLCAAPAHALVAPPPAVAQFGAVAFSDGGCTVDPSPSPPTTKLPTNGKVKKLRRSASGTVKDPGDSTDVSHFTASIDARVSAVITHGVPRSLQVSGRFAATVDGPEDSTCKATAEAIAIIAISVTLPAPTWVSYRTTQTKGALGAVVIGQDALGGGIFQGDGGSGGQSLLFGAQGTDSARILLPAGTTVVGVQQGALASGPGATSGFGPQGDAAKGTATATLRFTRAGYALGATAGRTGKVVKLADKVSCAKKSLEVSWKSKASGYKLAKVVVNGRAKTVRNPKAGRSLVLKRIAPAKVTRVKVTLIPRGRGEKRVATRSYESCA